MLNETKYILVYVVILISFSACANGANLCMLNPKLKKQIAVEYPNYKVIDKDDLVSEDLSLFEKDHGKACPGITKVDFFGNKRETYAIAIMKPIKEKLKINLITASLDKNNKWMFTILDSDSLNRAPVVWSEPAGKYQNLLAKKKISTKNPIVMFVGYESWAILYAWDQNKVKKLWVSD